MKKIVVIYPGFPHYRSGIIEELINSKKYKFIFAGDRKGYNNVKPYIFKDSEIFRNFNYFKLGRFQFNRGLLKFIIRNKFDGAIVHATPYCLSIILATLLLRFRGVQVFNWTHGILRDKKNLKNKTYYYFYKFFFDGLLLYSNNARRNLLNFGYSDERIKLIYNSLDYKKQLKLRGVLSEEMRVAIRKKLFADPQNYQLIFIGRLTPPKKLSQVIEVIDSLKNDGIAINLLLVGDGIDKESLQKQVISKGLEKNVCFYGASYDEKVNYELIASSDCCIAPGEIGLTAMHSLMFGVPVISHNNGNNQGPEYEAIIPNVNGELFEMNNIEDLKENIIKIRKRQMITSIESIRENCYKIIDKFYNPYYQKSVIDKIFD
ncbi:glycosyltransferase [Eudoraea adriatica]|uniref:glycosyltransferase n=1 Tax=Eudoraea adriatica TaxID=446681 RepID=UPI0003796EEB|nr:glycosyltransferase [Eudoraea adriatica]